VLVTAPGPARAVDAFEIQVYEGDINAPGRPGLEVHANMVPSGRDTAQPPARVAEDDLMRLTLEPSLGILEWFEVGAYLQLALEPGSPEGHFGGFKLRSKWIVPRRLTGNFILGLNVEVGRGTESFGTDSWDTEFRPILVWTTDRWMIAVNPMFGWALSGADRQLEPDFEPATKVRIDSGCGVGVGLEYYAGLGQLSALPPAEEQQHVLYLVADLMDAPFDANLGLGRGLTDATNAWTVKLIVGVGF
jgi:hypothetical protein